MLMVRDARFVRADSCRKHHGRPECSVAVAVVENGEAIVVAIATGTSEECAARVGDDDVIVTVLIKVGDGGRNRAHAA